MSEEHRNDINKKEHDSEENISEHSGSTSYGDAQETKEKNKKIYKKPWFWLVILLALIGLGLAIFAFIYLSAQSRNKQAVVSGWSDVVRESKTLSVLGDAVVDKDSFDKYKTQLQKINSTISDKKINSNKLTFKAQDVQRYDKFLVDFGKYTNDSAAFADKIADYTDADSEKLKAQSVTAKDSATDVRNNVKYLSESMSDGAFKIQEVLATGSKSILSKELAIKAAEQAQAAQSAKDKADKASVETATGNYFNAFIAGNAAQMRQYMTSAYQAEYDFNQLSASAREFVYPASFRILLTTKIDGNNYKVQANLLYKYRDGSSQYTVGNELNFIYNSGSASWLVNSIKEGAAF